MTESEVVTRPGPSIPPQEVEIAIYLQAALFIVGFVTLIDAYAFMGEEKGHPAAAAVITLLFTGIWALWLRGLWWRQNWVRWITVIWNIAVVCYAVWRGTVNDHGLPMLSYLLIPINGAVMVMLLRPVAHHWYQQKPG